MSVGATAAAAIVPRKSRRFIAADYRCEEPAGDFADRQVTILNACLDLRLDSALLAKHRRGLQITAGRST
jgi:hypothetical protein